MGRHAGERGRAPSYAAPRSRRTRILVLALTVSGTLSAWAVLVYAAIDFGKEARSGESTAWVFLAIATVGAAACLFTTLLLGGRMLTVLRGEPAPARSGNGHRAAR